jgi:hypothetical protein
MPVVIARIARIYLSPVEEANIETMRLVRQRITESIARAFDASFILGHEQRASEMTVDAEYTVEDIDATPSA